METNVQVNIEEQHSQQRSIILRVYNYYRIGLSFLFLFLFLDETFGKFVGTTNPELFQTTIIGYIIANVLIGITTLFVRVEILSKTAPSFIILTWDIICLSMLMAASGGVASGLGNFIIFVCAFGGGLIFGRVSTVLPAIAFILTLYCEFYLFFLDLNDVQGFFQAGLLGIVYFVANILFQTLSKQLRTRESEVVTLEQINKLVIDRMRTGVVVVSGEGNIQLINDSAQQLLETPNLGPATDKKLPYTLVDRLNEWKENPTPTTMTFHTHESGPELLASFSGLTEPALNYLIFIEDSTEAQQQAQQLKLAALGRLSASIAHEIRNPLGAISHAGQLLSESNNLDKGDQRLTEIIQNHCVRMNSVIENVLQMSRRRTAEPVELELHTWLTGFVEEFTAGIPDDVDIEVELAEPALTIFVDPLHLSQVLGNLCQNGLRYSAKNTGDARVRVVSDIEPTLGHPYIEVIDYGNGVAKEQEANLFEPFYTTEASGTGLGLYLSRELCEANQARLSYRRTEAGGSCFRITFLRQRKEPNQQ